MSSGSPAKRLSLLTLRDPLLSSLQRASHSVLMLCTSKLVRSHVLRRLGNLEFRPLRWRVLEAWLQTAASFPDWLEAAQASVGAPDGYAGNEGALRRFR